VKRDSAIASRTTARGSVSPDPLDPWFQGCALIHVSKAISWEIASFSETFSAILWTQPAADAAPDIAACCGTVPGSTTFNMEVIKRRRQQSVRV
jgi:hypothetical protein